ncbi:hypothetical protein [Thermomonas paludicola]|uniref:hypothetical protein n=1 Tax=Thermomonas paludicola TaxID=2884874 RepID=UPI0021147B17|nr:hypothetical protein [Thermomonas paludicola]
MASEMVTLPAEAIPHIRRMLVVGLHSYGECDRIRQEARAAEGMGQAVDPQLTPAMLSAEYETAAFAEALSWLDYAEPVAEAAA